MTGWEEISNSDCLAVHRTGRGCTFLLGRNETAIPVTQLEFQLFMFCFVLFFFVLFLFALGVSSLLTPCTPVPIHSGYCSRQNLAQTIFQVVFRLSVAGAEVPGAPRPLGSLLPFAEMVNMSPGSPSAKMVSALEQPSMEEAGAKQH